MTLSVFHLHFPSEVSKGAAYVSACVSSYFVYLSASFRLIIHFHLDIWL